MPCLVIRLKTLLKSFFHNIIYIFLEFHLFGFVNLQALLMLHCDIINTQIKFAYMIKQQILMKHNVINVIEFDNKKKFNYRLESKVGVKHNKENVL